MTAHRYRRADLAIQPWKNGGGVTREVVSVPGQTGAAGADFDWRVSIAHIAASGPFSSYAGIDRVITLLEGPGVHLRSPDGPIDHRLDTPLAPFAFPGEAAIHADLLGADCHDFNVMTRRDACAARVQVLREAVTLPRTGQGLFMAVHGRWALQGDLSVRLAADEGLWWHDGGLPWQVTPLDADATLLAVLIEPVAT
jgi:environmental stress-induced protein Ves